MVAYYFSQKMVRLILLLAAPACVLGGTGFAYTLEWAFVQLFGQSELSLESEEEAEDINEPSTPSKKGKKQKESVKRVGGQKRVGHPNRSNASKEMDKALHEFKGAYNEHKLMRQGLALVAFYFLFSNGFSFLHHSIKVAPRLSEPSIMLMARTQAGGKVIIDDFREAYWWLRDNTPEDSRVMSWWDYGYQINGIANRTTIADGNTWNHEHIALLGKALVSPVPEAHMIVRHLADYVLVWSTRHGGMMGDDIAKSPHMARIGGSVYKDVIAQDFYLTKEGPSDMMRDSLVFNLVNYRLDDQTPTEHFFDGTGEVSDDQYFQEVYTTSHSMVRIYKVLHVSEESKEYCAQGHGYKAWYEGRPLVDAYPPALNDVLSQKKDFEQLEDFNRRKEQA